MQPTFQSYSELKIDVERFYLDYLSENSIKKSAVKYYKGIQMLYSPMVHNPKFMFVGINPGAGYYNHYKKLVKRFSPLAYHEYYKGSYRLAQQTRKLFKLAKLSETDLISSVKSNNFFIATTSEDELYRLLSHFKEENIYWKSSIWIHELIRLVNPQIIICEGKSAFHRLVKNETVIESSTEFYHYAKWGTKHILGYNRTFSYILNIEEVAEKLKEIVSEFDKTNSHLKPPPISK